MSGRAIIVGITCDVAETARGLRAQAGMAYAESVVRAGEALSAAVAPVMLPPIPALAETHLAACDAFVFTGGDDPRMEPFGEATHPAATPMHPRRQEYEMRLLELLRTKRPEAPVLGICLGMQLMCLDAGGKLDQHLPDRLATAGRHKDGEHGIVPVAARGETLRRAVDPAEHPVASNHHQAVLDPGAALIVLAHSDDGVIEAVAASARPFYVGVQWHPERTRNGGGVFRRMIQAAARARGATAASGSAGC